MARSSTGKSVARAAATGGGTSYRGQMPINWYAALVVIVLIGIASVAVARYHYVKSPTAVEPIVGQTWHAGLAIDICGKEEPALAANPSSGSGSGLSTTGNGVLLIAPKVPSEAGNNANTGQVRQRGRDADADQHLGAVSRRCGLQERPEVRRGDP